MSISIVITTKNEEKNIFRILDSISKQSAKNKFEVIIVDNFSSDKTKELSLNFNFVKFYTFGPERSAQRNYGVKKSNYESILILDADMELSKNLLKSIENYSAKNEFDALYIDEKIKGKGIFGKARNLERKFYTGTNIDCARVFKKNVFFRVGGYSTNMTGPEDWDLDNKLLHNGYKIKLLNSDEAYIVHHETDITIFNYFKKKNNYSVDHNKFREKWKGSSYLNKQLGIKYRLFMVFFENKKYKIVIANLFVFILMYLVLLIKALIGFKTKLTT